MGGKTQNWRRGTSSWPVIFAMLIEIAMSVLVMGQTPQTITPPPRPAPVPGNNPADDILKRYPNGKVTTQPVQRITADYGTSRSIQPLRPSGITAQDTIRLAWLGWWEAESEAYLEPPDQRMTRPAVPKRAVDALFSLSKSNDPLVRAEVAMALARLDNPAAEEALAALAVDKADAVKFNAYLGLALLDCPRSAEFLSKAPATDSHERAMWLAAVGLMKTPPSAVWEEVLKTLGDANASREARRLALWTLRTQKPEITHQILEVVVDQVPELDLLNEALIGLGEVSQPEDMELLIDIAGWNSRVWDIAAIAAVGRPISTASTALTGAQRLAEQARKNGITIPPFWQYVRPTARYTSITIPALRNTAQRVLADHFAKSDRARDAIRRPFFMPKIRPQTIRTAPKPETTVMMDIPWQADEVAQRLISSGRTGDMDYLETANAQINLESQYETTDQRILANDALHSFDSSMREFAAISLGLYLRKAHPGETDAPGEISSVTGKQVPSASAPLTERVSMPIERSDLRAASALALGLSQNRSHAERLKEVIDNPDQGATDITKGFAILALGLLGDADTLKYAAAYLPPVEDESSPATLVKMYRSRAGKSLPFPNLAIARAVVEALEALQDPAAVPMLINHWGYDRNLNLSIAKALSALKPPKSGKADPLLTAFNSAILELASPADRSRPDLSAIAALGILYDDQAHVELAKLVADDSIVSPEVKKAAFRASYPATPPSLAGRRN